MYKKIFLIILSFQQLFSYQSNLPEPYRSIKLLRTTLETWIFEENKKNLRNLILTRKPKVIVELGSLLGGSAVFQASLMPKDGVLYAIDNWLIQTDLAFIIEEQKKIGIYDLQDKLQDLYQKFLSNVINAGLANKIIPVRMNTLEAAKALDVKPDLIFVDASHDEKSVYEDIINWYPKLNKGGVMCGDDWLWRDPKTNIETTQLGVKKAANYLNCQIMTDGTFWCYKPKA